MNPKSSSSFEEFFGKKGKTMEKAAEKQDENAILNALTEEQRNTVMKVLEDKEETQRILSSPKAKALMKALFGGQDGE